MRAGTKIRSPEGMRLALYFLESRWLVEELIDRLRSQSYAVIVKNQM